MLCDIIPAFQLTVIQGDIVKVQVDAIVHPTNSSFYMGGEVGKCNEPYHWHVEYVGVHLKTNRYIIKIKG